MFINILVLSSESRILPKDGIIVHNLDLIVRNREEKVVGVKRVAKALEQIHGQSKTDKVEPSLSLKGELPSSFIGQFLDEGILAGDLGLGQFRKIGAGTGLVEIRKSSEMFPCCPKASAYIRTTSA